MDVRAKSGFKEASMSIVVTRADGSVEDYGVVSYWHKNPLKRIYWNLRNRRRIR